MIKFQRKQSLFFWLLHRSEHTCVNLETKIQKLFAMWLTSSVAIRLGCVATIGDVVQAGAAAVLDGRLLQVGGDAIHFHLRWWGYRFHDIVAAIPAWRIGNKSWWVEHVRFAYAFVFCR